MAQLFHRQATEDIPSAQGLMVYARREGLISGLLSGLSHEDQGLREASVRPVLLAYLQAAGKDLHAASSYLAKLDPAAFTKLTDQLAALANKYHWE